MGKMNTQNNISESAFRQHQLIKENDHTLKDKSLRIDITGKGCDGFGYSLSFQSPLKDDVLKNIYFNSSIIKVYLSKFASEFLINFYVDYLFDPKNDIDHFTVTNLDQDKYKGKFWLKK